jgi:hypothetical protein
MPCKSRKTYLRFTIDDLKHTAKTRLDPYQKFAINIFSKYELGSQNQNVAAELSYV